MAKRRPHNVTRKQWENVVAMTLNAHANCFVFTAFHRNVPHDELLEFEAELKRRLTKPIDLRTIDWIWDEMVRLTPNGKTYSDRYRPTLPERLAESETENVSWGLEVD